jgi:hypothetical protein
MAQYVKVTLKEFMAIRDAVDSNAVHAESAVDDAYVEAVKAMPGFKVLQPGMPRTGSTQKMALFEKHSRRKIIWMARSRNGR